MGQVIEVDEHGELRLPAELLGNVKPRTRYVIEVQGETLILKPEERRPFWATATPAERAEEFRRWAEKERPPAPDLPLEALTRDAIYD